MVASGPGARTRLPRSRAPRGVGRRAAASPRRGQAAQPARAAAAQGGVVVPSDRLIEELWGDDPPEDARPRFTSTSRGSASCSSRTGCSRPARPGTWSRRHGALDLHRFERLGAEGRAALAGGAPSRPPARCVRRSVSGADGRSRTSTDEPFAREATQSLDEARLEVLEAASRRTSRSAGTPSSSASCGRWCAIRCGSGCARQLMPRCTDRDARPRRSTSYADARRDARRRARARAGAGAPAAPERDPRPRCGLDRESIRARARRGRVRRRLRSRGTAAGGRSRRARARCRVPPRPAAARPRRRAGGGRRPHRRWTAHRRRADARSSIAVRRGAAWVVDADARTVLGGRPASGSSRRLRRARRPPTSPPATHPSGWRTASRCGEPSSSGRWRRRWRGSMRRRARSAREPPPATRRAVSNLVENHVAGAATAPSGPSRPIRGRADRSRHGLGHGDPRAIRAAAAVAAGGAGVWVLGVDGDRSAARRADGGCASRARASRRRRSTAIAVGPDAAWVTSATDGTLWRVGAPAEVGAVDLAPGIDGRRGPRAGVWVVNPLAGTLVRVEPATSAAGGRCRSAASHGRSPPTGRTSGWRSRTARRRPRRRRWPAIRRCPRRCASRLPRARQADVSSSRTCRCRGDPAQRHADGPGDRLRPPRARVPRRRDTASRTSRATTRSPAPACMTRRNAPPTRAPTAEPGHHRGDRNAELGLRRRGAAGAQPRTAGHWRRCRH